MKNKILQSILDVMPAGQEKMKAAMIFALLDGRDYPDFLSDLNVLLDGWNDQLAEPV